METGKSLEKKCKRYGLFFMNLRERERERGETIIYLINMRVCKFQIMNKL